MGILLETVLPDRRFILRLAAWRLAVSFIFLGITVKHFSQSALDAPLRWLLLAMLWLGLFLGWLAAGLSPLRFLTRRVSFYENGMSAEPFDVPLELLERIRWRRKPFRLLGVFPLPFYMDEMICILKPEGRRKHGRRVRISGFYFSGLRDAFDRAYEFSIPWEFVSAPKRRHKRRAVNARQPTPMGPAVPPMSAPPATAAPAHPPEDS